MTIKALYPTVRPTLNLDFAKTKTLDPRVTFTRASTATFVGANGLIQTAASGAARFDHNPTTGESLGLLVEEARTNLITYSEQFNNAAWIRPINTTVTANTHVAPDGTTTADTINAISNQITGNAAVTANTTYAVSVFIRKTTGATIFPMIAINEFTSGPQRVLNTNTGQLVVRDAALNTGIQCESVGSYWRVSYSGNVGANTTLLFLIYPAASTNGSSYTGGLTGSIIVWGAQLEAGSFPTSYIPTTTATVTRAADVASITGANFSSWYNQSAGSIFVKSSSARVADDNYHGVFALSDNSPVEMIESYARTDNHLFVNVGGTGQALLDAGAYTSNVPSKLAVGFAANSFAASLDGGSVATDLSGAMPTVNRLYIANNRNGGGPLNGTIARLAYYPVRLPDAQLQALTAT